MGLSLLLANELLELGPSPPSVVEVIRKVGFLKRYEAATPDGLFPSFFKDVGELLTLKLTKSYDQDSTCFL